MRKLTLLSVLFLAAGAAAADNRAGVDHGPTPSLEDLARAFSANPQFREAAESRPLFFRLDSPAREVLFAVTVGGRPTLQERVTLGATHESTPAVEFLSRDAARLERLYTLAANKVVPVEVIVFADGREARRFGFDEFVRYNHDLKSGGLRPVAGESQVQVLVPEPTAAAPTDRTAAPQPDGPCQDQCYWDYLDCRDLLCGGGGCIIPPCPLVTPDLPDCSYCDTQYDNCLANCAPCTDPKSVTTYSTTELIGITTLYWDCFRSWYDPNPNPTYGDWYEVLQLTYKVTSYRRTEYCNGTVVIEVTGVSYAYASCNHPIYLTCYYPFLYPYNVCY